MVALSSVSRKVKQMADFIAGCFAEDDTKGTSTSITNNAEYSDRRILQHKDYPRNTPFALDTNINDVNINTKRSLNSEAIRCTDVPSITVLGGTTPLWLEANVNMNDNEVNGRESILMRYRPPSQNVLRPPQRLLAIDSDRHSTLSTDSEGTNVYDLMTRIEGLEWSVDELLASFDTQSPNNFIFRPALNKIGNIREHDIPPGKLKPYTSPLNSREEIVPTKFVVLRLWVYQIDLHVKVRLKVMEVPEEPNGFQIILGRPFLKDNNGDGTLLRKIELANMEGTERPASVSSRFAPIRRGKRSKEQQALDKAKDEAYDEERRRTQAKLYQSSGASTSLYAVSSTQTQSTNTSNPIAAYYGPYSATSAFNPIVSAAQRSSTSLPDHAERLSQRTDTSFSQSTQLTHYSFASTDSSASSCAGPPIPLADKTEERLARLEYTKSTLVSGKQQ